MVVNFNERIKPDGISIIGYLEDLKNGNFQIPTFQREVVWERENVKKLWDSIYKFYPLGSILIWKTDLKLKNHRKIGGTVINNGDNRTEYKYILDGQQRTTSLLTSIYGGSIENQPKFNPELYVDLSIDLINEVDDETYKERFLFFDEIDDDKGNIKRNSKKMKKYQEGLIIKLYDILHNYYIIEDRLEHREDYKEKIRPHLRVLKRILDNYKISYIELKGIEIGEVCQIFERINQAGKPLSIFDIVVAKTFEPITEDNEGFYLRELIDKFREDLIDRGINSTFLDLDDETILLTIATIINQNVNDSNIHNITPTNLNKLTSIQINQVWDATKDALIKTFDFFENTLKIKGRQFIPFRYMYLTYSSYFYMNKNPDYQFLKKYFWFYSFQDEDTLKNTGSLFEHINFLNSVKKSRHYEFGKFTINKYKLRTATYSSKGRLSRAVLSLFASKEPKDWEFKDRIVLSNNIFTNTDKPNLHHIFPINYINKLNLRYEINHNSLMNIAYLTAKTNRDISDSSPLEYIKKYDDLNFEEILKNHFISSKLLNWVRENSMPDDALNIFIEDRIDLIINELKKILELPEDKFQVINIEN
ncbi:MAG: DUF262 domain-containing protein [Candidatus Nanoarchaeia archaeon]